MLVLVVSPSLLVFVVSSLPLVFVVSPLLVFAVSPLLVLIVTPSIQVCYFFLSPLGLYAFPESMMHAGRQSLVELSALWQILIHLALEELVWKPGIHVSSQTLRKFIPQPLNEPRRKKTGLRGFRPGPTQTGLYKLRKELEA